MVSFLLGTYPEVGLLDKKVIFLVAYIFLKEYIAIN